MKLSQFNESLERLGEVRLTEANEDSMSKRKEILKSRFEKLEQVKQLIAKSLQNIKLSTDIEKFSNYVTVLDWIYKISAPLKNLATVSTDKEFETKVKYADHYMNQVLKSVNGGKLVYESFLSESLNYINEGDINVTI